MVISPLQHSVKINVLRLTLCIKHQSVTAVCDTLISHSQVSGSPKNMDAKEITTFDENCVHQ